MTEHIPIVELLQRENKVEHNSIPDQGIDHSKPDEPSKLADINFNFWAEHDQHRAPSKSLHNQGNNLKIWVYKNKLPDQL